MSPLRARLTVKKLPLYLAFTAATALFASTPALSAGADHGLAPVTRTATHLPVDLRAAAHDALPNPIGLSLGIAPLASPYGRLTSPYGYRQSRRSHRRKFHAGVDFEAPRGTEVRNVRRGVVESVPRNRERNSGFGGYGNAVVVRHEDEGVWVLYAHLTSVAVEPGDRVEAGQLLGTAGRTSNRQFPSMAPHLHLEVRVATPQGESPFPGSYRRHNVNPRCWFARHGLYYGVDGGLGSRPSAAHARCRG